MTTPADARAVEEAFEAALAGRPGSADARALIAFTDAVRAEATAPGRPNAALAELLVTGLLTDPSRTTVGRPASRSRKRTRMIISTLVAKVAAAGAVAKAATAGGAVAIALTGAVTTDVLPLPGEEPAAVDSGEVAAEAPEDVVAEDGVETDEDGAPEGDEGETPVEEPAEEPVDEVVPDDGAGPVGPLSYDAWIAGPAEGQPFGQWVSAGAHEGWTSGALVSCFAQARQDKPNKPDVADCQALAQAPVEETPAPVEEEAPAPVPGTDAVEEVAPAPAPAPAPSGPGNGHGNGGGNGNNGNGNGNGNGGGRR